jgi:hypothetical protein
VIHGTADNAVNIAHAKKYAPLIPGAKTLWLEGEGHFVRESALSVVLDAVLKLFEPGKGELMSGV